MKTRIPITTEHLEVATEAVYKNLGARIKQHSNDAHASAHETLGVVAEEYDKLKDAVRSNDPQQVYRELSDLCVSCLWGMATFIAENGENDG